jgi:glyoxylase-like metal-dependent hydrolase (beta-lactamase superfamily II)
VFHRHRLPVASAPGGTASAYRIGHERALLVDPAAPVTVDAGVEVAHVALTHHHPDHAGGVTAHADATVWARAGRTDAFERATGVTPDRTFREGDHVPTDAGPVTVVETPGHAPEHVAFALPGDVGAADTGAADGAALLVGDLAVAEGSVAVAAPEGDLRAYLTSLRRLHARAPARLHPGHGPPIEDPRAATARLLARRRERERRVLAAVTTGARAVPDVTDAAYDRDLEGVRALAEATVRAHLEKLAVEGRIRFDDERATTVDAPAGRSGREPRD